jgi:serpin B
MKNVFVKIISAILTCALLFSFAACNKSPATVGGSETPDVNGGFAPPDTDPDNKTNDTIDVLELSDSIDLMDGTKCGAVNRRSADDRFIRSQAEFGLELFKKSIKDGKNSLVSPLSVMLALAMTANGADGATLAEMEAVLGGDIPLDELNEYLHTYWSLLPSSEKAKLNIANSIWFRDNENAITVEKDFLKKNADYYGASAYRSPFDNDTVKDINNWVKYNTDGMIDGILDQIPAEAVMYIINAICFDAEWLSPYDSKYDVREGTFYGLSGATTVEMMYSNEYRFVSDENACGFIKPYENGYSFMAILPNEDISLADYIDTLEGDDLVKLYKTPEHVTVNATLPKFKYEYSVTLNDPLKDMGMKGAFSGGFGRMGRGVWGDFKISNVIHKTFIEVDNNGTRAAAVTAVECVPTSAEPTIPKTVRLDRPFLYAIVDNSTGLPIFIGTVNDIEG